MNSHPLFVDPRGRSEADWLDTLDFLVAELREATGCYLHTGVYWVSDHPEYTSASLTVRVRSRSALPGTKSDYWDAAVCFTGGKEGAYSDVYAFPFLDGSPMLRLGRLADLGPNEEVDEFRWFQFADGRFVTRGWGFPDGPGEWGWIQKPGDEYWEYLKVEVASEEITLDQPLLVRIRDLGKPSHQNPTSRLSLLYVNRNRENTSLVPWNERPPRPNSQHVLRWEDIRFVRHDAEIDLRAFNIRGGWTPGKYHIAFRSQNFHEKNDWAWESQISKPFQVTISERR